MTLSPRLRIALTLTASIASCLLHNHPPLSWAWWFAGMFGVLYCLIELQDEEFKAREAR